LKAFAKIEHFDSTSWAFKVLENEIMASFPRTMLLGTALQENWDKLSPLALVYLSGTSLL
jgi:hypothetical protein